MHTTNLYPTPFHLVRFGGLKELSSSFLNNPFGLSDHTITNHACFGAVALGASILERHFTDHKERTGPDIVCSMDEKESKELIDGCNIIWQMRGGSKEPSKEEKVTIDFAFASVVSTESIKKGDTLTESNIWVKRPGTGDFLAKDFENLLGKKASNDIKKDSQIQKNDIE